MENKCLKCANETKEIKDNKFECPFCGLIWKVEASGEWIFYCNLDLSWSLNPILLPKILTIHGDLNLMGCHAVEKSLNNLQVDGCIYLCYTFEITSVRL